MGRGITQNPPCFLAGKQKFTKNFAKALSLSFDIPISEIIAIIEGGERMEHVSALSVHTAAPHGRAGPGIWEQNSDGGFIDFISALMSRSEPPAARAGPDISAEPPPVMWTASRIETSATAEKAVPIDKDVESVVSPQRVDSQDDLIRLIALLLGEEENDGFLFAFKLYIQEQPALLMILEDFPVNAGDEEKLSNLLDLLLRIAREIPQDEDLPLELAPLANLFIMFAPPPVPPLQTDGSETPLQAETAEPAPAGQESVGENVTQTVGPRAGMQAETVQGEAGVLIRDLPDTVRVTGLKIASPRRATYANPFSVIQAVTLNQTLETAGQAEPIEAAPMPEEPFAQATDEPVIWDLTEPIETPDSSGKPEYGTEGKPEAVSTLQEIAPQAAAPQPTIPIAETAQPSQTAETAPARQILAERIIDQIAAQAAKTQDVSVLQMELNPKFLGKIQLVIEATAEGMTAKLRSDNGSVRSLLNENLAELRNSLRDAGINMKDLEITEPRISTYLSDRRSQQGGAETAEQMNGKKGKIPAIAATEETGRPEPPAAYTIGRVSGYTDDSQFDYRA
jgi:hypothetical protein